MSRGNHFIIETIRRIIDANIKRYEKAGVRMIGTFLRPKFQRDCCLQNRVLLLYVLDYEMPSLRQACDVIIAKDSTHERFSVKDPHRNGSMEKNKSCCLKKQIVPANLKHIS